MELMESTQNPNQEPFQNSVPVPTPQSKPNLIIIVFSILGIILLVSIIFLFFQNQKLQKQLVNQPVPPTVQPSFPTPKTVSSISIPPDETANWKKYTDLLGYTFSYPNESQLEKLKDRVIVRIDPPDIRNIVGICPRYISFSSVNTESTSKTSQDKYSCVYETKILGEKIFIESQYPKNKKDLIDQILSTFKFLGRNSQASSCTPKFKVESGPELTASEAYSQKCYEVKTKERCEKVDIYRESTQNFGNSDGIPDCLWSKQFLN